jgi:hypothetical protein
MAAGQRRGYSETRVGHWLAFGSVHRRYVLDGGVGRLCLLILLSPLKERGRGASGPRRPDCNSLANPMAQVRRALATWSGDRRHHPDCGVPMTRPLANEPLS